MEAKDIPLSNLRNLHLTGSVAPHQLAAWISSLPRLETLSLLHGAEYEEPGCWKRRLVLDAIRRHPSLLHVQLKIACEDREGCFVATLSTFTQNSSQAKRAFQMVAGAYRDMSMKLELEEESISLC